MQGRVFSYIHHNGQVGSLVKISTITDFAALTDEFIGFGKDIAMQVAMNDPSTVDELLGQTFIKEDISIDTLLGRITETLGKTVSIVSFQRYSFRN
jgi:translation elongation factor EF-Ts